MQYRQLHWQHGLNTPVEVLLTQKGDKVRFSLSDAFLPSAEELGVLGAPDEQVEGTVINFSDSGTSQSYFAVVDVVRRRSVVVPVEKLEVMPRHGKSLPGHQQ